MAVRQPRRIRIEGAIPIGEVLSGDHILRIPGFYQRDFCWTVEEAVELLRDLLGTMDRNGSAAAGPYLLGMFVFAAIERGVREVVDGQQRLTTLVILLACLRDRAEDAGVADELDALIARKASGGGREALLLPKDEAADFLRRAIQDRGATGVELVAPDGDADAAGILAIRATFLEALDRMSPERRRALGRFIADDCHVAAVTIPDADRAPEVFAQLNLRGRPLLFTDRLKADIVSQVPTERRLPAALEWDRIKDRLGETFHVSGGGRRNLFSYIADLYGTEPRGRIEDNIRALARVDGPERFIAEHLAPVGDTLADIEQKRFEGGRQQREIAAFLTYLSWLPQRDWVAPALYYISRRRSEPVKVLRFLRALDRYAYAAMILGGASRRRAERFERVIDALKRAPDEVEPATLLVLSEGEVRTFWQNVTFRLEGGEAKLVLLRVHVRLLREAGRRGVIAEAEEILTERTNIEHVLPLNPRAQSDWLKTFGAEHGKFARYLGNLFVVPESFNTGQGNADWSEKRKAFIAHQAEDGLLLPLADMIPTGRFSKWNQKAIDARHAKLCETIKRIWEI